jgi:hypothetical protein
MASGQPVRTCAQPLNCGNRCILSLGHSLPRTVLNGRYREVVLTVSHYESHPQRSTKKAGREQTRPTSCWKSWSRALQQHAKPFVVALHLLGDSPADLAAATNSCSSRNDTDEFRRPTPFDISEVLASCYTCLLLEAAPLQILLKIRINVRREY